MTNNVPDLLGLSHLKKLFNDYQNPSHPLSDGEKEEKLYNMLPLFCKVKQRWTNVLYVKSSRVTFEENLFSCLSQKF